MKAAEIRKLARDCDAETLQQAADALMNGDGAPFDIAGEDDGERLTHVMLAQRCRARADAGEDLKTVWREVMGEVRDLLTDEPD